MKTFIAAASVLVLYSTAAFAGVLPIAGKYCGSDVIVDAKGVWSEDDAPFDKVTKTGPDAWTVTYSGEFNAGITSRITLSRDKKTATIADIPGDTYTLHRCR